MAPPDVSAWPGVELGHPLTGGSRAPVFRAHRDGHLLVVKASSRTPASLAWELELLQTLDHAALRVPVTVPTVDGRPSRHGVVVQTFLPGQPPRTRQDWAGVAAFIARVHDLTPTWPQRPGSLGIRQLLTQDRGGDVDLTAMPAPAVGLVRACWRELLDQVDVAPIAGTQRGGSCVVHGDLGAVPSWSTTGRSGSSTATKHGSTSPYSTSWGSRDTRTPRTSTPWWCSWRHWPGRPPPAGCPNPDTPATCWTNCATRPAHQAPTTPLDRTPKTSQPTLDRRSCFDTAAPMGRSPSDTCMPTMTSPPARAP